MDISNTETGSYIITPISTLVGRLKIEDSPPKWQCTSIYDCCSLRDIFS